MTLTVAEIAKLAFDGVARGIGGVVHEAQIEFRQPGSYDVATGRRAIAKPDFAGRAIEDSSKPISDVFPDYQFGKSDRMVLLEGFDYPPEKGARLVYAGRDLTIHEVADVAGGDGLFYVVAR